MDIKILCFDLDGTFLNEKKQISQANLDALSAAADKGVFIVPATGRIYHGLPDVLKTLPFMRYYITANGAYIYDAVKQEVISKAEIAPDTAQRFYDYADTLPVIYDCYKDNWGYMSRHMLEQSADYIPNPVILRLVQGLRTPVDDLKEFLRREGGGLQKMQLFFKDLNERARQLDILPELFPELLFSSSMPFNVEINSFDGSKGHALLRLCAILGLEAAQAMAIGDGSNDTDMLVAAGVGVAMGNAPDSVKAAADFVTLGCDEDGFAAAVERFILT